MLIEGRGLASAEPDEVNPVGLSDTAPQPDPITRNALMRTLLVVFICIILGYLAQAGDPDPRPDAAALRALPARRHARRQPDGPDPVSSNRSATPRRCPLVSEFTLGVFLAVSLMALQLWALAGMAGTLLGVLAVQTVLALAVSRYLAFRLLGQDYQAAVMTAGYASFVLGATPDRHRHHDGGDQALRPLPDRLHRAAMVSALFVDIANALVTQGFLNLWTP